MANTTAMPLIAFVILLAGYVAFASWLFYKERHQR